MLRAPAGMRHDSDIYMGDASEEDGRAGISAARVSTDIEAAYQVVVEAIGKLCSVN